jgi:ATP phosphoribosyltransferase regulatory subunit
MTSYKILMSGRMNKTSHLCCKLLVDELTGDRALAFERVRRQLIDLYTDKGFGLVIPPMVENIESLLLTSESVNKKTFKFLDPSSGKMLGVHADITPQIARIDAKQDFPNSVQSAQ